MAQSSDAIAALSFGFLPLVTEKLTRGNYGMWHAQVSSTLKGAQLTGFIKSTAKPPAEFLEADDAAAAKAAMKQVDPLPNPEYKKWVAKDSQVLSYLFSFLSKEIFSQV
jgi:hypothetical protein